KVIVVENHKLPRVSFSVFVDTPPFLERDHVGAASMAGELLRAGTLNQTKSQIDEAVDFIGASLNTSANGVFGSCLTKHQDELLNIMQDVLLNPTFPEEEFEKAKKRLISNLVQEKEDANAIASKVGSALRFGKDHPYGEIETEETINNLSVDLCKAYYNFYFKPNISYLTIVGDITPEKARALAESAFGDWEKGNVDKANFPTPQKPGKPVVEFVNKNGAVQSVINISYPVELKPGAPDAIKASVANTMFGGFFGSRLNSNLREDKGYTYGARASLNADPYVGSFVASASVRNEVTDSSLVEFLKEMERMGAEEVSDEEITLVKNVITGNFARGLENPQTIARFARNTLRYNLPEDYYATYLEKVAAVTKSDILEMAKKYITPNDCHILVVGNKDEVADKLARFDAEGKVRFFDHEANPISGEGMKIPDGVTAETVIQDYIAAVGGAEKLKNIRSVKQTMTANMGGMGIAMTSYQAEPNKTCIEVAMNGQVMQKVVFDGEKGQIVAMGQAQPMPDDMAAEMKAAGQIVPELFYAQNGVQLNLKGIEKIGDKNAYQVEIVLPTGKKRTDYFDMETGLKIRQIKTEAGNTETVDFGDYKEVVGVKFPFKQTISGSMPMPLELQVTDLKINEDIPADIFKLN
ncbi:MAG: insulinase family protein, partial [Bacteroidetes bacterium]